MRQTIRTAVAVVAVAAAAAAVARAADENTISVVGSATVKGRPTVVVVTATVAAEAELAADASVKYADLKKKATAALAALKMPDLTVEEMGSSVDTSVDAAQQQRIMQGQGGAADQKQKVRITESLHLTLKGGDQPDPAKLMGQVLRVIDAARDAGLQVGPPPPRNWYELQNQSNTGTAGLATYKIPDVSALQDQAYKAAMDDARHRAQRLADLSGVKLGRVVSAQDQGAASGANGSESAAASAAARDATSSTLSDIPVTVHLNVQYEIVK